jgi:hypothetical protein
MRIKHSYCLSALHYRLFVTASLERNSEGVRLEGSTATLADEQGKAAFPSMFIAVAGWFTVVFKIDDTVIGSARMHVIATDRGGGEIQPCIELFNVCTSPANVSETIATLGLTPRKGFLVCTDIITRVLSSCTPGRHVHRLR